MKTRAINWVEVESVGIAYRTHSKTLTDILANKMLHSFYEPNTPRVSIETHRIGGRVFTKSPFLFDCELNEVYEEAHSRNEWKRNFYTVDRIEEYRAKRDRLDGVL